MNTVFLIKPFSTNSDQYSGDDFQVEIEGVGQETASLALRSYRDHKVILKGFVNINSEGKKRFYSYN